MAAYLVVGGLGYGVFAQHASGWDVLKFSSATGGYLVGMLVAATLVGWLADRGWDRKAMRSLPAMILGNVVIYAFGFFWLKHALDVTASQAWTSASGPSCPATRSRSCSPPVCSRRLGSSSTPYAADPSPAAAAVSDSRQRLSVPSAMMGA